MQKVSNKDKLWDVINQFDHDKDGLIEADEIFKALEIIENEKVKISKKHLKEIFDLISDLKKDICIPDYCYIRWIGPKQTISPLHNDPLLAQMNFTELFQLTSRQCSFSPGEQYLTCVNQYRLIIRLATTLEIIHLFACIDTINTIEWSYDSYLILAGLIKRNAVQVFSSDNPE
ncbi:unnamed protein product [Rotaria sp. Silwood1]|nr:unnamed protein product [Rotaria sp. Silwood1]CAF1205725.1 unnamed protein product [Rotaria sp. Silwood1]CAF1209500.1 unnamed protein product [Rotaria sp. Silwood1]CAF3502926.1 unnamed protein product [Rotaria sp. Silwood1]CAF3505980.1 unnamed protein product [Rotaria sp. Silwood1]